MSELPQESQQYGQALHLLAIMCHPAISSKVRAMCVMIILKTEGEIFSSAFLFGKHSMCISFFGVCWWYKGNIGLCCCHCLVCLTNSARASLRKKTQRPCFKNKPLSPVSDLVSSTERVKAVKLTVFVSECYYFWYCFCGVSCKLSSSVRLQQVQKKNSSKCLSSWWVT